MAKEQKHGAVEWSDNSYSEKQGGKDLYLKLTPGSNVVRLVTVPYQYYMHKYKFEGEKGFGNRIYCSGAHGSCDVCGTGDKPKRRWLVGAIDRKSNAYKVLDIGWAVYKEIQGYNRDEDWGDPSAYDIDIVVNPKAPPISYYSTVPKPKKPLTAGDMAIKDSVDTEYLIFKTAAPEPEKVKERFEMLRVQAETGGQGGNDQGGWGGNQGGQNRSMGQQNSQWGGQMQNQRPAAPVADPSQPKPQATTVEEDDTDFPDYDQKEAGF